MILRAAVVLLGLRRQYVLVRSHVRLPVLVPNPLDLAEHPEEIQTGQFFQILHAPLARAD